MIDTTTPPLTPGAFLSSINGKNEMPIIYCRVSPKPKRANAPTVDSIKVQRDICEKYCQSLGIDEYEVITDREVSGRKTPLAERPGGKRLLELIENGEKTVVVMRLDRIFRNLADGYEHLENWDNQGVQLIIASQNQTIDVSKPDGWLSCIMSLVFAEYEPRQLGYRVSTSAKIRGENGYYTGGWMPAHMEVDEDGKLRKRQEWRDIERKIALYDKQGMGRRQITNELKHGGHDVTEWQVRQALLRMEDQR